MATGALPVAIFVVPSDRETSTAIPLAVSTMPLTGNGIAMLFLKLLFVLPMIDHRGAIK
jgi:hypothetical protein